MCGRFTRNYSWREIHEMLDLKWPASLEVRASFNVAPTQGSPVVIVNEKGERGMRAMRWGLVPFWAKDDSIGSKMINARAETAAEKPAFRAAMAKRRCVVPISGFYEWKKAGKGKQPYYIERADERPMLLAGLWERWDKGDGPLETFTIVTVEANDLMATMHDRMPAVLEPEQVGAWLDAERVPAEQARALLRPCDPALLMCRPVSPRVNSPRNDDRGLIEELKEQKGTLFG